MSIVKWNWDLLRHFRKSFKRLIDVKIKGAEMGNIKVIILESFSILALIFFLIGCSAGNGSETYNSNEDTPEWLSEKIDSILSASGHYNDLTKVYRYSWNKSFIYYFYNPLSSCMYCELYDQDGKKMMANNDSLLQNTLNTRDGEILIWENRK